MRLKEQRLWDSMRNNAPSAVKLYRVENGVGVGMPDVHSLCRGAYTWVELKAKAAWPARATTPVLGKDDGLNQDQINWHIEHARFGGESYVLIGVGSGAKRELFMVPGTLANSINSMTKESMLNWACDWGAIFKNLGS